LFSRQILLNYESDLIEEKLFLKGERDLKKKLAKTQAELAGVQFIPRSLSSDE
jgi:hypothetical protein